MRNKFDQEVDNYCAFSALQRPRCTEWVLFSQTYADRYERWNGCWVAERAVVEWYRYTTAPEGAYEAPDFPEGSDFR